ncbi:MAG: hypothetical protein IKS21_03845 [Oscillospiraceae bacterium]|nr:hypothetical protein [Oscillospiraceae bacterium]
MRVSFRRVRLRTRLRRPRVWLLVLALLLALVLYVRFRWLPTVHELVTMELENEVSNLINDAVDAYLEQGQLRYDDLVRLERTADGSVAAAQIDLGEVNRMKSVILRELGDRLPDRVRQSVHVPIGNVLLPALLSGRGGSLPVRVVSLRSTNAELESELEQTGINQSLHRLALRVEVDLLL